MLSNRGRVTWVGVEVEVEEEEVAVAEPHPLHCHLLQGEEAVAPPLRPR